MTLWIVTFAVLLLFIALMALGVLMGRKPLQGSCGGLGKLMNKSCDFCKDKDKCVNE